MSVSFDTIIAFAENSAFPHAIPTDKKIEGKGFLTIDFGCVYNGYCSDQAVTYIIGEPTDQMNDMYDTVYTAQQKAIQAVKPGLKCSDIHNIAYDYIIEKGYGEYIQHGVGHGIGLEIHEMPFVNSKSDSEIKQGMIFSVEPGIYIPEVGGVRIEDLVLVTSNGCEVLTSIPKEKKVIL